MRTIKIPPGGLRGQHSAEGREGRQRGDGKGVRAGRNTLTSLISNQRIVNLSSMWRLKGRKSTWERTGERKSAGGNQRSRREKRSDGAQAGAKIQLKQISILNKQSEETPSNLFISTSESRWKWSGTKTITDRASEIFSGSMASGNYLLLDGAANRLKLPLSLCQDENVQLCFPATA